MIDNTTDQRTLAWYRARLGCVTGSRCGDLMKTGRRKDETFSETAKSYLYRLAAERMMNPAIVDDDELFAQYLDSTTAQSRAMRFGTEQEDSARRLLASMLGVEIRECSTCRHDDIPRFAASPDGVIYHPGTLRPAAVLEIKSPGQETYVRYRDLISDAATLREVMPEYYWQTQAEMMCVGVPLCIFAVYSPWQRIPIHVAVIRQDFDDAQRLELRIREADKYITSITHHYEQTTIPIQDILHTVLPRAPRGPL